LESFFSVFVYSYGIQLVLMLTNKGGVKTTVDDPSKWHNFFLTFYQIWNRAVKLDDITLEDDLTIWCEVTSDVIVN